MPATSGVATIEPRVFAIDRVFERVINRHERQRGLKRVRAARSNRPPIRSGIPIGRTGRRQLVANGLRHTPDGGTVQMRAPADRLATALMVTDRKWHPARTPPARVRALYKADDSRTSGLAAAVSDCPSSRPSMSSTAERSACAALQARPLSPSRCRFNQRQRICSRRPRRSAGALGARDRARCGGAAASRACRRCGR